MSWGARATTCLSWAHGRIGVALSQVVVSQDETAGRRCRIRGNERLQLAELARVDVDVRVETGHRRPVPARARPRARRRVAPRRGRTSRPRRGPGPELVERGVVRKDLQCLIGELECAGIVAGAEGRSRRVELRDGGVGDLRRGAGPTACRWVDCSHTCRRARSPSAAHRRRPSARSRSAGPQSPFGVVGVRVAGIAPVVERRAEGPGRHPGRGSDSETSPIPSCCLW